MSNLNTLSDAHEDLAVAAAETIVREAQQALGVAGVELGVGAETQSAPDNEGTGMAEDSAEKFDQSPTSAFNSLVDPR